jgi:hypothetical protein
MEPASVRHPATWQFTQSGILVDLKRLTYPGTDPPERPIDARASIFCRVCRPGQGVAITRLSPSLSLSLSAAERLFAGIMPDAQIVDE